MPDYYDIDGKRLTQRERDESPSRAMQLGFYESDQGRTIVSTVFTGQDERKDKTVGVPMIFETMVHTVGTSPVFIHYATLSEATACHDALVAEREGPCEQS